MLIFLFSILFSIQVIANENDLLEAFYKAIETRDSSALNPNQVEVVSYPSKSQTDQQNIKLESYISIERMNEQIEARGGDDVGNGGDLLREQIYFSTRLSIQRLIDKYGAVFTFSDNERVNLNELNSLLTEKNIIIVEDIRMIPITNQHVKLNYYTDGKKMLIKRSYLDALIGSDNDLRQLFIHILLKCIGLEDVNFEKSLEIYSFLEVDSTNNIGKNPVCVFNFSNYSIDTKVISQVLRISNSPVENGIHTCQELGLRDCRIKSYLKKSSFLRGTEYFEVTFEGKKLELLNSKSDCSVVKQCRDIYNSSPLGQIGAREYLQVENKFQRFCL